jgi:precorrin-8X/cobalt-precorrin-8 methylmutase
MFDTFVMIDWSAASVPRTGRDSIWICWHAPDGERLVNPATRHSAKMVVAEWLATAMSNGQRVLMGFDFPFGYPAGFADRLGLSGVPWRAVWDEIAGLVTDDEHNANNRFDVAATLNERMSGGRFPFWGCPANPTRTCLGSKHHRAHEQHGLAERRLIDEYMVGAQPCWKLLGAGSVGGQILTGIPVVRALRDDPRWRDEARIWPFETGLGPCPDGRLVMAEVYPSLWSVSPVAGEPKDAAQVRIVARFFAARDQAGDLDALFLGDPELTRGQRACVESEEAWTLGVTARSQRPRSLQASTTPRSPAVRAFSSTGFAPTLPSPASGGGLGSGRRGKTATVRGHTYLRDPAEIAQRSFALIRNEADLSRFPRPLQPLALRLAHAAGDSGILDDLAWSRGAITAGRKALDGGAPILVDSTMVAAGIATQRLAAGNVILCTLRDPKTAALAKTHGTTRSAAAIELWREHLAGAVVAIGNAPTALFRLLEIVAEGAAKPALVLGFPVGFVGAAEAKQALAAFGDRLAYVTLHGRRGGSALAAAAVNALAGMR